MEKKPFTEFFKDKTVTLVGLGLLGRGVGDAAFLAKYCKKVYITDMKGEADLRVSVEALKDYSNIEYCLGRHDESLFANKDFIVKAAGVRLDNSFIALAKKNGIPVYMSAALFASLSSIKTVAVTGTRGKTTTTCMIAEILKRAGKKVILGGNIRGVSTLAQLPEAHTFDVAVLELDSWQLQGFDDLKISPNVSVFTTFYPDHMNYYDGDMDRYMYDKASIFRHQRAGDAFITTSIVADRVKSELAEESRKADWIVAEPLPASFPLQLPGVHNLTNGGLAKAAALVCGVDEKTIDAALKEFKAVEGRLQFVGTWNKRDIYNDNNATTQEATLAAVASFPPESIVLIFGGNDKGLPIDRLMSFISDNSVRCVLIKGSGIGRALQVLPRIHVSNSMQEAVKVAVDMSKPNDKIILSPAFASFGIFKNEYDRSDQFMNEIKTLIAGGSCQR